MDIIKFIIVAIEKFKPKSIYKIIPKIDCLSNDAYKLRMYYIIDDDSDLLIPIWEGQVSYRLKGDEVFYEFEKDIISFIKNYLNAQAYQSGRGVMKKSYYKKNPHHASF